MKQVSKVAGDPLQVIFQYHQATKHRPESYAKGPGYMDWATQPSPFRRYEGARLVSLERIVPTEKPWYDDVFVQGRLQTASVSARSISQLFYDSLAISAWKSAGDTSWSLRVNPSSGNLHPTEGYLISGPVEGLCNVPAVYHYAPKEHGLEVRAEFSAGLWSELCEKLPLGTFFVGLTSIPWREAWKYGQRAFRYCQHDVGHAVGAISIAAAGLGWRTTVLDDIAADELEALMGTGGDDDAEREEPDVMIAVVPSVTESKESGLQRDLILKFASLDWHGTPNQLSPSHVDWGVDEALVATRKPCITGQYEPFSDPMSVSPGGDVRQISLRKMIRRRRSAVAMDGKTRIRREIFFGILQKTLVRSGAAPFGTLPWKPHVHLAVFVHRIDDLPMGLYFLIRDRSQITALQDAIGPSFQWRRPDGCPDGLDLYCLIETDTRNAARQISCFQDIASDGCFSIGMIAEFEEPLRRYGPWFYPRLYWEAGVIGQVLYLEAEVQGIRSTGIGCYFDDQMHDVLGLKDRGYQDLYHFTIGGPVEDTRLRTLPSYPDS